MRQMRKAHTKTIVDLLLHSVSLDNSGDRDKALRPRLIRSEQTEEVEKAKGQVWPLWASWVRLSFFSQIEGGSDHGKIVFVRNILWNTVAGT
jgi:hypothetical protein